MKPSSIDIQSYQGLLEAHAEALELFKSLLVEENTKYNLTRITSPEQVQTRHFLDSLTGLGLLDGLSRKFGRDLRIVDAGSGAGFPGLVLGLVRPAWSVISLEATDKKVRFQKKVCDALELRNVQVIHGRAEETSHQASFRERFDAVTARAMAAMPMLAEVTLGLVRENGLGVFWKGSDIAKEITAAGDAIKQMGGRIEQIIPYDLPDETGVSMKMSLVVCRKIHAAPEKYPRAFGVIKKTPIGNHLY